MIFHVYEVMCEVLTVMISGGTWIRALLRTLQCVSGVWCAVVLVTVRNLRNFLAEPAGFGNVEEFGIIF